MKLRLPIIKRKFKVPSRSEAGEFHIVSLLSNGEMDCDCISSMYNRPCYHIKVVKQYLENGKRKTR